MASEIVYKSAAGVYLVNESYKVFAQLNDITQKRRKTRTVTAGDSLLTADELITISDEYRNIIRQAINVAHSNISTTEEGETIREHIRCSDLLWSLARLLFIRSPHSSLQLDLIEWARANFTQGDMWTAEIRRELSEGHIRHVYDHPKYWHTLYSCIVFGRFTDAHRILAMHTRINDTPFVSVSELLRKAPLHVFESNEDAFEWREWQNECRRRCEGGQFNSDNELRICVELLSGNEHVLRQLPQEGVLNTWYETLVPLLLFSHTNVDIVDLHTLIPKSMNICAPISDETSQLPALHRCIQSMIQLDLISALNEMRVASYAGDMWLVAHLGDLLHKCGYVELYTQYNDTTNILTETTTDFMDLRQHLIVSYANELIMCPSTSTLSISYFVAADEPGRCALQSKVEEMNMNDMSDDIAMNMVAKMEEHKLDDMITVFCTRLCHAAMQRRDVKSALKWCMQSNLIGGMAEWCLLEFGEAVVQQSIHLLHHTPTADRAPALVFLEAYSKMLCTIESGDMVCAADECVRLLESFMAPRCFWPTLLTHVKRIGDSLLVNAQRENDNEICANGAKNTKQTLNRRLCGRMISALQLMDMEVNTCHNIKPYCGGDINGDALAQMKQTLVHCSRAFVQLTSLAITNS